jgi:UPF0755 protein
MARRARQQKKGGVRRLIAAFSSALSVLAVVALVGAGLVIWQVNGAGPAAKETTVLLRRGAGVAEIGSTLEQAKVIRSSAVFAAVAQITGSGRELKAGEYAFPAKASLRDVLARIREGKVVRHLVTIPEGVTSEMAVEILMANPVLTGSVAAPSEGSILPESYDVQRGEERSAVLQRMMVAQDKLLADLWPKRQNGLPFTTPDAAVTLASIVEKETAVPAERPRIAAVFVNRLRQGIRLESDPTIIYGLTRGRPLGRGIRQSEVTGTSPYNTYQIAGLPPTPIANPGRASLAAVLDPPKTSELFFVADGTGGHVFASTYADHLRNVARWRAVEQQKGQIDNQPAGTPPGAAR